MADSGAEEEVLAVGVTVEFLGERLQNAPKQLLLIDCRPFMAFNTCHIKTAHNVHCPTIVKRRSGGTLSLENVIRCSKTRSRLVTGGYSSIVIYDERSRDITDLPCDSTMYLVLKTFAENPVTEQNLKFLTGGFELFARLRPDWCSSTSLPAGLLHTPSEEHSPSSCLSYTQPTAHTMVANRPLMLKLVPSCGDPVTDKGDPVEILPWLYIGSVGHAGKSERLKCLGITALLNVSYAEVDLLPPGIQYKKIGIDDNCTSDISRWFPEAIKFIESVRQQKGRVLVHCRAGISRSATICIAYLMYYKEMSLEEAYDYLQHRRSIIQPNLNFMRQLLEFETELMKEHVKQAKKAVLTPTTCVQQAAVPVFAFDLPSPSPNGTPALRMCPSPLLSPS